MQHKFPSDLRRHYEKMARFPAGYLVLGDAMCSFNPIYAQGMTVAAMEALTLSQCLQAQPDSDLTGLSERFFKQVMPVIDIPWTLATGEDWRFPEVDGPRPRAQGFINRYVVQVHRAAMTDPVVLRAFFRVANLNQPPASLFRPAILARVLMANRPGRRVPAPARAAVPLVLRYGDCPARRRGHFIATKDIKDVLAEQDDAGRHPKGSGRVILFGRHLMMGRTSPI